MTLFNKIKWILGVLLVFVVVLTTNLIDRQNFSIVSDSIETIYADRLIAQDIIYDITKLLGKKEVAYASLEGEPLAARIKLLNAQIFDFIGLFSTTKLTPKEKIIFSRLRDSLNKLTSAEAETDKSKTETVPAEPLAMIWEQLDELSAIQLEEGRRELQESKRAITSANLFTQLEIGALIFMAVIIQVIILYSPKLEGEG
jgi:hypothetical protein